MTKHFPVIETKDADPVDAVTAALDELKASVDGRLKAIETKSANAAVDAGELADLKAALTKIETKLARPGIITTKSDETGEIERKAFANYLRYGDKHLFADDLKALTVSKDPGGGYFVPKPVSDEFIRNLVDVSPIRNLATVRPVEAASIIYPKRTDITNAKWKGETQSSEASQPSFGQVEIVVRELTTHVDLSNDLLADSTQALAEVNLALADDFGAKEGLAFLRGDGELAPMGLLMDPSIQSIDSAGAGGLTTDDLITFMYALPAAYRNRGAWIMNSTTLAQLRRWKDGAGNYLWQPAYAAGQPETILGRPVVEANDMPNIAEGETPIMFGDFKTGYRIIDRSPMRTFSNPYLLATQGFTRIHAWMRVGAGVVQPDALRKLRVKS